MSFAGTTHQGMRAVRVAVAGEVDISTSDPRLRQALEAAVAAGGIGHRRSQRSEPSSTQAACRANIGRTGPPKPRV